MKNRTHGALHASACLGLGLTVALSAGILSAQTAAGPVFGLLGARDVGDKDDYRVAKMPPANTGLLDGELAWRQHDGGHEDRSNMKHFIAWANKLIKHTPPAAAATAG